MSSWAERVAPQQQQRASSSHHDPLSKQEGPSRTAPSQTSNEPSTVVESTTSARINNNNNNKSAAPHPDPTQSKREQEQARLHRLLLRKADRKHAEEQELLFRHEQMKKREEQGTNKKATKVLFLSDFLTANTSSTAAAKLSSSVPERSAARSEESKPQPEGRVKRPAAAGPDHSTQQPPRNSSTSSLAVAVTLPPKEGLSKRAALESKLRLSATAAAATTTADHHLSRPQGRRRIDPDKQQKPRSPTQVKRAVWAAREKAFLLHCSDAIPSPSHPVAAVVEGQPSDRLVQGDVASLPNHDNDQGSSRLLNSAAADELSSAAPTNPPITSPSVQLIEAMKSSTEILTTLYRDLQAARTKGDDANAKRLLRKLQRLKKKADARELPAGSGQQQPTQQYDVCGRNAELHRADEEPQTEIAPKVTKETTTTVEGETCGPSSSPPSATADEQPDSGGDDDAHDEDEEGDLVTIALSEPLQQTVVRPTERSAKSEGSSSTDGIVCNFFPSLTQLRCGEHPQTRLLDKRRETAAAAAAAVDKQESHRPLTTTVVREYCRNILSLPLDQAAFAFLQKLCLAQRKLKQTQPLHFASRMRYCSGLREVLRSVLSRRARLVMVAPDVEPVAGEKSEALYNTLAASACATGSSSVATPSTVAEQQESWVKELESFTRQSTVRALGLEGSMQLLILLCDAKRVPWVCCLSRRELGFALRLSRSHVSAVAILSAEGAHEEYRTVVACTVEAKAEYQQLGPSSVS